MGYLSIVFNKFHEKRDVNIINEFRERIWKALPYEKLNRKYRYTVSGDIDEDIQEVLKEYSNIEYKVLKSRYKKNELMSEEFIKARINSNYGKFFDKEVYLGKQYYYHLANYKNIYFSYLNDECEDVLKEIEDNTKELNRCKEESLKKKLDLTWEEYKSLVNGIIPKIFDNYIPMDNKIDEGSWCPNQNLDWDEDNYIIKYFNKCLDGEILNYTKEIKGTRYSKGKKRNCEYCGKEIKIQNKYDSSTKYCKKCRMEIRKEQVRLAVKKAKNKKGNQSL